MGRSGIIKGPIDESIEIRDIGRSSTSIGAIVVFRGVIRESSPQGKVEELFYDYYPEMVERTLAEIRKKAIELFGLLDATILHRVGEVPVGETALLVIAASEHREAAFDAVKWMVDEVKRSAAIWKKEILADGDERWIEGDG